MEGSTGAQRSFWVDKRLVGFAWERSAGGTDYWMRVQSKDAPQGEEPPKVPAVPEGQGLRVARELAGLSQAEAAALLYRTARNWQQWELGERRMDPALWELFQLKVRARTAK